MHVLITGGRGSLGRALIPAITGNGKGHVVRVMSRRARRESVTTEVEWAQADIASGSGIEEAVEQSYYDDEDKIFEASYLQCPTRNHDSDDGWEIEAFSKIYVCGVCNTRYTSLNPAAVCCIEKEND